MRETVSAAGNLLLGLSPWLPLQSRYGLRSLTADELTMALAADTPGARIDSLAADTGWTGTTDRARLRLAWNEIGRAAGLPETVFAKGTPSQGAARALVSVTNCHGNETRFFNQIHPTVADLTMRSYIARSGSGGRYVVALEDLGTRADVMFYDAGDSPPLSHVEAVIDLLAALHGRFWRTTRFDAELAWVPSYSNQPGISLIRRLLTWSAKRLDERRPDISETVRQLTIEYVRNQARFVRVWESLPPTLCHGDCHLGNTYAHTDGRAGLFDWQVIRRMNGLTDFAYFLTHSVPTDLRRAHETDLLRRYLDGLAAAGAGTQAPPFAAAFDTYRLLTIPAWAAVMVTIAIGGLQPDARMSTAADRAIATLIDLDAAKAFTQLG